VFEGYAFQGHVVSVDAVHRAESRRQWRGTTFTMQTNVDGAAIQCAVSALRPSKRNGARLGWAHNHVCMLNANF